MSFQPLTAAEKEMAQWYAQTMGELTKERKAAERKPGARAPAPVFVPQGRTHPERRKVPETGRNYSNTQLRSVKTRREMNNLRNITLEDREKWYSFYPEQDNRHSAFRKEAKPAPERHIHIVSLGPAWFHGIGRKAAERAIRYSLLPKSHLQGFPLGEEKIVPESEFGRMIRAGMIANARDDVFEYEPQDEGSGRPHTEHGRRYMGDGAPIRYAQRRRSFF